MRRIVNIVLCACALALASCVGNGNICDTTNNNTPSEDKGVVTLNVSTRAESGGKRDYILSIFKNESGKSTLVRKYDSSKENMQKPEYIWLLAGNYTANVESGTNISATFNEAEQYFCGSKSFDIAAGSTTTVDLVAVMQNIPVEVVFDQTIVDGFIDGYNVEVKANDEVKLTYTESKKGYFIMPEGVTTLSWHFAGTFVYEDGERVNVDKSGTIENIEAKKAYKLSFKYSSDAMGILEGLSVRIDESIEERDDHFSFSPDPELKGVGFDITAPCNYAGGERKYIATSPADFKAVSIVVGGKEFNPVEGVPGIAIAGLNTPQLYITLSDDFFNTLSGGSHLIELCVTDTSGGEARKELPYNLQGVNALKSSAVNLWSGIAPISATVFGTPASVTIVCREGEGEWQSFAAAPNGTNTYTAQASGIGAGRTYEYNLVIDGKTVGVSSSFSTAEGVQIPNGDLEDWCTNGDGVIIPYHTPTNAYWCTGNYGTAILSKNITQSSTDVRPGSKGTKSMYMDSEYIVIKFAAGNGYIGSWGGMDGTNAKVYFGQPFEYNAKPKAIRFWAKWKSGKIDKVKGKVAKEGDPDLCKIFCALTTDRHLVDSSKAKETTFSPSDKDIKSGDARYDKVLYSAYFESTESQTEWKEITIPFTFYGKDPNQVPSHLILTFTCSGYGDFFDGSTDSWLYVDDIEFVY